MFMVIQWQGHLLNGEVDSAHQMEPDQGVTMR